MEPDAELTIDEVAAATGMTVRNVRAHQSRGLLPPPRIVGRTGIYGPHHVRRLDQIRQLQHEGLNLVAIARLIEDDRLADVATGPFRVEEPQRRPVGEVADRFRLSVDDPSIKRAIDLGLIAFEGDQVRVEVPRLVEVAGELADQGVPLAAMLDVVEEVRDASAKVAAAFMHLADEFLVEGVVVDTGGDLDQITDAVQALQVQASAALGVMFNRAMSAEIRAYLSAPEPDSAPVG